ncbi:GMC family oxidoreductase [Sphingopyxis panaciterrulae]|uniref:Choline dehydrogenase-like flavoprotein n=1 Tax=Sphingopyxis panaciterrulae TaxID=462372 RepID=A0A7W9B2S8_9SPHN|nr:GMC family oxidoreductase N-terminal domain-containing protein [Sphingopyxis panaciterrulae]MBB5705052.1 choline dehydrogenase-like flavoprotein [Sphingopyxis panaciterrulae]
MDRFDIIVIGGGSAGSAAAGRLAEDGTRRVCLVEAGGSNDIIRVKTPGFMPFIPKASNYRYDTVPQAGLGGRIGYQPRGRGLGGSSAINAMVYIRGNAFDYDQWAELGATGWSYADVLPYFRRSEGNERGDDDFHGGDGPLNVMDQRWPNVTSRRFVESAASLQLPRTPDFNGAQQEGFGLYQVTQKAGERWSAARAYVEPLRGRANLDIRTGALVEKILIEDGRATGVVIRRGGKRETLRAAGGVILSAGAFNSPQILMLSGIGPAAHLRAHGIGVVADRAGVGANLQDHIDYVSSWETRSTEPFGDSMGGTWRMLKAVVEHRRKRTGILTTCFAEAGGFWTSRPGLPAPDIQYHFVPAMLEDHGRTKVKGHGFSCHACVLRPESRGSVTLASGDAAAAPRIDPGFLTDDRDIATLRAGVRMMHRIVGAPPLSDYGGVDRHPVDLEDDSALDALIRSRADTVYHPVGTCRMGSDADAVVDPALKLKGIEGLWVADASVMPRLVSGNTNAPSIMIGERAADFVKAALG